VGQVVDRGTDFPTWVQQELDHYGSDMWHFRDQAAVQTTRAVNRYLGEFRECVFGYAFGGIGLN
jgi:hypothetical protein